MLKQLKLYDAAAVRQLDQETIERYGVSGIELMQRAGKAIAQTLSGFALPNDQLLITVFTGKGNNGGDGYIAARWLKLWGYTVQIYSACPVTQVQGDAKLALDQWIDRAEKVIEIDFNKDLKQQIQFSTSQKHIWLDALLGTGISGPVRAEIQSLLDYLNNARVEYQPHIIAVDLPSGINASTGEVHCQPLAANQTITMGVDKVGLHVWPAAEFAGGVEIVDLDYPAELISQAPTNIQLLNEHAFAVQVRPRDGHKGSFGNALVIAGSKSMPGAAALTSCAALRAGCGKTFVASTTGGHTLLPPEVLQIHLGETTETVLLSLTTELSQMHAVAIGPGLGRSQVSRHFVEYALNNIQVPLVLDADALWYALDFKHLCQTRHQPLILTPHPKEAARLFNSSANAVNQNRLDAARQLARDYNCIVVLKGAGTIVTDGTKISIAPFANPALSVPGSGDVLTGVIVSLIAQGYDSISAAELGVWLHGQAGSGIHAIGGLASELADQVAVVRSQFS